MTYTIIDKNAEETLFAYILAQEHDLKDELTSNIKFVQCRFFQINLKPSPDDIQKCLSDSGIDEELTLYFFNDGDVFIRFDDGLPEKSVDAIFEQYETQIEEFIKLDEFFQNYSLKVSLKALKAECFRKQKKQSKKSQELAKHLTSSQLLQTFSNTLQLISMQRSFRIKPHILIVEDQAFSQKLLLSTLKDYTCYVADSVGEALLMYVEKCPDILLLDIDLPDISGHQFAKAIKKIDNSAYTVMISANRYEEDIKLAQENQVKGFIAKPFKKDDILGVLDGFSKNRKRKVS